LKLKNSFFFFPSVTKQGKYDYSLLTNLLQF